MNSHDRRWTRTTGFGSMLTLAALLSVGGAPPALAQNPPDPAANHVWGGCVLDFTGGEGSNDTTDNLIENIEAGPGLDGAEVAFVVVYTLANPNDGQPLTGGGFTGPILCINEDAVGITARESDDTTPLTENSDIPDDTGPAGATSVDIVDAEEQFILQYQVNGGDSDGDIEKRICHTVAENTDCFIIYPLGGE